MAIFHWQRAVIKVGSALIAPEGDQCSGQFLLPIANFINVCRTHGKEIILVSSGSVAAGKNQVKHQHKPSIAEKQAMAAIGQTRMMANWARFFDFPCAQILLTADDLRDRNRYVNIQNTLRQLLKHQALPIINENDSVAIDELKVGDNDNLAACTALVARADTLIICSDIDGLYTDDPRTNDNATLIAKVEQINEDLFSLASGAGSSVGTGGMVTKLQAAQTCMQAGIQSLIVNGRNPAVFDALMQGETPGTLFVPAISTDSARTQWLKHAMPSQGRLEVDEGAMRALSQQGASLLPVGITDVSGQFHSGGAVDIIHQGELIAKGLSQYSAAELNKIKGVASDHLASVLGYHNADVAVHRDDLVLLNSLKVNN